MRILFFPKFPEKLETVNRRQFIGTARATQPWVGDWERGEAWNPQGEHSLSKSIPLSRSGSLAPASSPQALWTQHTLQCLEGSRIVTEGLNQVQTSLLGGAWNIRSDYSSISAGLNNIRMFALWALELLKSITNLHWFLRNETRQCEECAIIGCGYHQDTNAHPSW